MTQQQHPITPPLELVQRVAAAITDACPNYGDASPQEASAAIREVAAWLREHSPEVHLFNAGLVLDRELEQ